MLQTGDGLPVTSGWTFLCYFWQLLFFPQQVPACCFVFWLQKKITWLTKQDQALSRKASAQFLWAWCIFLSNVYWLQAGEGCNGTIAWWWQSHHIGTADWNLTEVCNFWHHCAKLEKDFSRWFLLRSAPKQPSSSLDGLVHQTFNWMYCRSNLLLKAQVRC